jgi:uncharacterized OB-fold protein
VSGLEVRRGQRWERPVPAGGGPASHYWKEAAEGRLVVQRCPSCGNRQFYPRALCTACGGEPEWEEVSGRGTVYTFTVIRQQGAPPFRDELPYVVAMIRLDEGPLMMGNLTDCPADDVTIGMPVEAYVVEADEGVGVPFWRPARPAS